MAAAALALTLTAVWRREDVNDLVRSAYRPAGGAWSPAVDLTGAVTAVSDPQVVVDPAGTATAAWRADTALAPGFNLLWASTRPPGGAWSDPVLVSQGGSHEVYAFDLVTDAVGTASLLFNQTDGTQARIRWSSRPAGGTWSAYGPVSSNAFPVAEPDLAVDPAGTLTAVWWQSNSMHSVITTSTKPVGGAWEAAKDLSDDDVDSSLPQVAVDANGTAMVTWRTGSSDPNFSVLASTRSADGTWTAAPAPLSAVGDIAAPDLVVDAAGNATAVWTRRVNGHEVAEWAGRPAGGSWSAAVALSDPDLTASEPQLGSDAAGTVTATWALHSPSIVQSARRPVGGAWSAAVPLSDRTKGAERSRLAIAPNGDGVAVWEVLFGAGAVAAAGLDVASPVVSGVNAPASGVVGQVLAYGSSVTDAWSPLQSVVWFFGDGTTAQGTNPVHAYAAPGSYTVTLTATDASGNATSVTRTTAVTAVTAAAKPAITTFKLAKKTIATDEKTKLKVKVSAAATLKVVLKSKHRHLVKGKKKYLKVVVKRQLPAGLSRVTIKGKKLKPDTWKIVGTARNSAGTSAKKKTTLVVVRP